MVSGTSGEKEVVDAYYRMGAQSGKKVTLYERSGGGAVQSTCGEMISSVGHDKYANAYLDNYKKLTPEEFNGACKANIIKYVLRADEKGGIEDYEKAMQYLKWLQESSIPRMTSFLSLMYYLYTHPF